MPTVTSTRETTTIIGARAEDQALKFLSNQGLTLIKRNFRCKLGEIDLIMRHQNLLVFVEVRLRRSRGYQTGAESVTAAKRQRLIRTADWYLRDHPQTPATGYRFDVVSIDDDIDWIQRAFDVDG